MYHDPSLYEVVRMLVESWSCRKRLGIPLVIVLSVILLFLVIVIG